MKKLDKPDLFLRVNTWSSSLLDLQHFYSHFIDKFGGWANDEDLSIRKKIEILLENVEQLMTVRFRDTLTEQVKAWDLERMDSNEG